MRYFISFIALLLSNIAFSQTIDKRFLNDFWEAQWITHPSAHLKAYEVYHFRKNFDLPEVPKAFTVHLSADSRYKFFVNGKMIGLGPARSDLAHWYFDTYDLSPYLQKGNNTLAAVVWNQGEWNGLAQHSHRTAFLLQGNSASEAVVNSNDQWKVLKNEAYQPVIFKPSDPRLFWQYYVAGALDSVDAGKYPWQWEQPGYNDAAWQAPKSVGRGTPIGPENYTLWDLTPRPVNFLENTHHYFNALRKSEGMQVASNFPAAGSSLTVPANSTVTLLLDSKYEATGYPQLTVSGGKNSYIKMSYAETLLDIEKDNPYKWHKTARNEVEGKKFVGVHDAFMPDGGGSRTFVPLWMRVFRYVQLEIKTGSEPLVINDVSYTQSWYPFKNEALFTSNDPVHQKIFDACLRTIRLASQETYIDPYYEQMQYIGDTRIQALYGYYHFKDDRLTRNAIQQFNWSRSPEGITMSRYPSSLPQYTPLYALCWMLMVADHWMLRSDDAFVQQFVPGMLQVLDWFKTKINNEGMIGDLPYLDFLDSHYDKRKILQASKSSSLTPYALFYVYTVQQLKPFFEHFNRSAEIARHLQTANGVRQNVIDKCYDQSKGLFAENGEKKFFSQHSNIMAVLTDCVPAEEQKVLMQKVLRDTSLIPVSLYFKFYQFEALKKADMGSEIINEMTDWKAMLDSGMNTFSEWLKDPRSECHSWSAYPAYFFLNTIAGIQPARPGFKQVLIEPNVATLENIVATMPHPKGAIQVAYQKRQNGAWTAEVALPEGVPGLFKWKEKTFDLKSGSKTKLELSGQ